MFELKYKITDADMLAVNKRIMWQYFIPYLAVALAGLGAGIAATVLRPRTEILVLGIILIVLAAVLLVCTALLSIAPKNFVASVLLTDEERERHVIFDDNCITVKTDNESDIIIRYAELTKLKNKKTHLLLFVGKDQLLLVKDALTGGTLDDLAAYIIDRASAAVAPAPAPAPVEAAEPAKEPAAEADAPTEEPAAEKPAEQTEAPAEDAAEHNS